MRLMFNRARFKPEYLIYCGIDFLDFYLLDFKSLSLYSLMCISSIVDSILLPLMSDCFRVIFIFHFIIFRKFHSGNIEKNYNY